MLLDDDVPLERAQIASEQDGESTGQVDDCRQSAGQQPVWFKSVNDVDAPRPVYAGPL